MISTITLRPTAEQLRAMDLFETGQSLKINAFAGSGKTATLAFLASTTTHPGAYLAFNRSLAEDARTRLPDHVLCRTTHQLAYHATPSMFRDNREKMFGTINANFVASTFRLQTVQFSSDVKLTARQRGALILETLRKFQQSADRSVSVNHVPDWGKLDGIPQASRQTIQNDAVHYASQLWRRMIDPSDPIPLSHDGYYKLWALSNPIIPGDYIMIDESQDTNGAMLGVLEKQQAQVVYVGDRYQQIYEWRGAISAMERVETDHQTTLTMSFRFGSEIAGAASGILKRLGEIEQIHGNPEIKSRLDCTTPDAILCRTNAGVIEHVIAALDNHQRPFVIGGNNELTRLLKSVSELKSGIPVTLPEFYGFADWYEIVEFSESAEGAHLRTLVKLIQKHGENGLLRILNQVDVSESDADIVLSTIHRAKGRQWDHVVVNNDFDIPERSQAGEEEGIASELRLAYVALTRARYEVRFPNLASLL